MSKWSPKTHFFQFLFIILIPSEYFCTLAVKRKGEREVPLPSASCSRRKRGMEKALTKVGSFWISKKAKEEISSIGEDLSRFSSTVEEKAKWVFEKLKGKPQKSLPELLREYGLPSGLFPLNIICYEFDESKAKLVVHLPSCCEVSFKDSSVLRYSTRIKAILSRGKLSGIEGMKTKVIVWVKVSHVSLESHRSDKVCFTAGVKKLRPRDAYEMPRDSIKVAEF